MRGTDPVSDPHDALGVAPGATERQIKEAYRRLAARWHPDRNAHPRAAEQMARINQAYQQILQQVAGGPRATAAAGPAGAGPRARPEAAAPPATAAGAETAGKEEPGSSARKPRPWWERDWRGARWEPDGPPTELQALRHTAHLTLEQAAFGCTHELRGEVADACPGCLGSGRLRATRADCRPCGGQGRVRLTPRGSLQVCPACGGDGAERKPCEDCEGRGLAQPPRSYHFEVSIPGGLRPGQSVKLRGQGQRRGAQAGDIELTLALLPHALFHFDEQQRLACRVPVDAYAQLGEGSVEVPALEGGTFTLALAGRGPGCPPQAVPGRGYPQRNGSRGPLMVLLQTVQPGAHTAEQQHLLRQLADDRRKGGHVHSPALAEWQRLLGERGASR